MRAQMSFSGRPRKINVGVSCAAESMHCPAKRFAAANATALENDAVNLQPRFAKAFSGEVGTDSPQKMRILVARAKSDSIRTEFALTCVRSRSGFHMNFQQAIASGFRNYVTFAGRASRSEYWFWTLFAILVGAAAAILDAALFPGLDARPIHSLASLALFLP